MTETHCLKNIGILSKSHASIFDEIWKTSFCANFRPLSVHKAPGFFSQKTHLYQFQAFTLM